MKPVAYTKGSRYNMPESSGAVAKRTARISQRNLNKKYEIKSQNKTSGFFKKYF